MSNCVNFNLCRETLPEWMNKCIKCDLTFGKWNGGKGILKEYQDVECPICLEIKTCFEQPKCDHTLCRECFSTIYFGEISDNQVEISIGKEPTHPYQDVLDKYEELKIDYSDMEDNIELYPLVPEWKIKFQTWYDLKEDLIERISTDKCPLCRKQN